MRITMNRKTKIFLLTYICANLVEQPAPEVRIEQGILRGVISGNGEFYEYRGIPYGSVTKESRFQAPLPPPKWDGVYKAVDEYHSCAQKFNGIAQIVTGTEDCLKVNVYVPAKVKKKPLPVMVFIHGGGFFMGSGGKLVYGPNFIVKHDVILASFNYRLGVLGFLCLGIKEAPGNAGLKDQVAALKWIKKNIIAFGGDPDNVTIFGESAGATSTSFLVASKATEGLFNRAIIQSGSSLASWAISRYPIWIASLLAKNLGHNTQEPQELYNIFKDMPYYTLTSGRIQKPIEQFFETQLLHLPCVEKSFPDIEPIITDLPYNILKNKEMNKNISLMLGFNDREGIFMISRETEESLIARDKLYLFASDLEFPNNNEANEVNKKIRDLYFDKHDQISTKTILDVAELYTDLYFGIPEILETELLAINKNRKIYNYHFTYGGSRNIVKFMNGYVTAKGAVHADELFYLFDAKLWPFSITEDDRLKIDQMTTMWTNFAKYGDPTPEITSKLPVKWETSTKDNLKFLYIDNELKMGPVPRKKSYDLWKDIYTRYRRKTGSLE